MVTNSPATGAAGDSGSIPGSGRSPRGGHPNPLQYSCLENPMDRGAWWAAVHRVEKSRIELKRLGVHTHSLELSETMQSWPFLRACTRLLVLKCMQLCWAYSGAELLGHGACLARWVLKCWCSFFCRLLLDHFQFALIHGPNVPDSYAILLFTTSDFTSITSHIHNWAWFLFCLCLHCFWSYFSTLL